MVKNLKKLRENANISQKQLADIIHVSQQSINKYENHDVEPNIDTLCSIADYFDVSTDYLIGKTSIMKMSEPTEKFALNEKEQEIITSFRKLSKQDRETLLLLAKRLSKQ